VLPCSCDNRAIVSHLHTNKKIADSPEKRANALVSSLVVNLNFLDRFTAGRADATIETARAPSAHQKAPPIISRPKPKPSRSAFRHIADAVDGTKTKRAQAWIFPLSSLGNFSSDTMETFLGSQSSTNLLQTMSHGPMYRLKICHDRRVRRKLNPARTPHLRQRQSSA